jgi:hypothetical protein
MPAPSGEHIARFKSVHAVPLCTRASPKVTKLEIFRPHVKTISLQSGDYKKGDATIMNTHLNLAIPPIATSVCKYPISAFE